MARGQQIFMIIYMCAYIILWLACIVFIYIYGIMMYNTAVTGVYIIVIINFTLHVRNLKRRGMQSSDCNSTLKYMHAQFGLKCDEYYYI